MNSWFYWGWNVPASHSLTWEPADEQFAVLGGTGQNQAWDLPTLWHPGSCLLMFFELQLWYYRSIYTVYRKKGDLNALVFKGNHLDDLGLTTPCRTCLLCLLVSACNGTWLLEQPHLSMFRWFPRFRHITSQMRETWLWLIEQLFRLGLSMVITNWDWVMLSVVFGCARVTSCDFPVPYSPAWP